jgi:hypothetical protein
VSESRVEVAERGGGADSGSRHRGRHRVVGQWAVMADAELSFWGYQGGSNVVDYRDQGGSGLTGGGRRRSGVSRQRG